MRARNTGDVTCAEWVVGMPVDAHCPHAVPYAASCLHGVCIFCWRDRCGKLNAALKEARESPGFTRSAE